MFDVDRLGSRAVALYRPAVSVETASSAARRVRGTARRGKLSPS